MKAADIANSKRLRSITICLGLNFVLFTLGIFKGADLAALGAGLALLNTPLYLYIYGETARPSGTKPKK